MPLSNVAGAWNRKNPHRKLVIEVSSEDLGSIGETAMGDVDAEAEGAEAARIGGTVTPLSDDPAREPLEEAGEGEAEGFEQAERRLEEIAEQGDQHRFPDRDVRDAEDRESMQRGEADQPIPPDE